MQGLKILRPYMSIKTMQLKKSKMNIAVFSNGIRPAR